MTVTPPDGFYLQNVICTNGYSVSNVIKGKKAYNQQTININNNSNDNDSECTFYFERGFYINNTVISGSTGATINKSSIVSSKKYTVSNTGLGLGGLKIHTTFEIGDSITFEFTPKNGGYLYSFKCDSGYSYTNVNTGSGATYTQRVTITKVSDVENSNGAIKSCSITTKK